MRPPPSLHSNFFSSLKQVEKRLKLEQPSQTSIISSPPPPPPIPLESHNFSEESVISPLYLDFDQSKNCLNSSTCPESSEIPRAFLSCSPQFMLTHENPIQPSCLDSKNTIDEGEGEVEVEAVDDIEQLIQLLGLSDFGGEKEGKGGLGLKGSGSGCNSCYCEDGFYSKIAGVKGPKCEKEVERLEGWIKYFLNGGGEEKMEPLRLSLLLLGKAAFVSEGDDGGFGGLDFPSTIDDFLMNDPPTI